MYGTIEAGYGASSPEMNFKVGNAPAQILKLNSSGLDVTGSVVADGLTVDLADNSGILLQSPNTSSTAFINFGDSASSTSGSISYDHYTDALRFKTVNTERLRLSNNGDISFYNPAGTSQNLFWDSSASSLGIGDTSPTNGYLTIRGATTTGTVNGHIMLTGDGATVGEGPQIVFSESGTSSNWVGATIGFARTASGGVGDLIFSTRPALGLSTTTAVEALRIDSSGSVLIGNTVANPASGYTTQKGFGYEASTGKTEVATTADAPVMQIGKNHANDGSIVVFRKQSTSVGSIGTQGGDLNIGTGACGIAFVDGVPALYPWTTTGNITRDAAIDLGDSGARFKDLHLSGISYSAKNRIGTTATIGSSSEILTVKSLSSGHSAFENNHAGNGTLYIENKETTANSYQPAIIIKSGGGNRGNIGVEYSTSTLGIAGHAGISLRTGNTSLNAATERLFISSTGNVKIVDTLSVGTTSTLKGYFYESTVDQNGTGKPSSVVGLAAKIDTRGEGPSLDFNAVWGGAGAYQQDNWNEGWTVGRIAGVYHSAGLDTGALAFYTQTSGSSGGANSSSLTEKMRIDNSGNVGIGTAAPTQKLEVAGTALVENAKLKAIAASNTDTAIDVFVYDTRKDSDGGAWRKRTQNTSWYNEALNTSTRGARKEFPCVAIMVAQVNKLTIYDGDDPDMPMWMDFVTGGGSFADHTLLGPNSTSSSVQALNGVVAVTKSTGGYTLVLLDFLKETSEICRSNNEAGLRGLHSTREFSKRNIVSGEHDTPIKQLVNNTGNDVAMTVLPNAPIDADTGLPVPTIAVATDGGVSVIKDDGTVVDILTDGQNGNKVFKVAITDNKYIDQLYGYSNVYAYIVFRSEITSADTSLPVANRLLHQSGIPYALADNNNSEKLSTFVNANYMGGALGLTYLTPNLTDRTAQMVNYITSDYNTGWMHGDIKLATLSDTDTTNISASGNTNLLSGQWTNNGSFPYETFTTSGLDITSAINTTAYGAANKTWTSTAGKTYTAYFNLTLNSGTAPTLYVQTSSSFGNGVSYQTKNGVNAFTFTATMSTSSYFSFSVSNGVATNFSVSNLELYEGGVADRSVNRDSSGLSVFGTVTKTAVATGADLVGYSGFSTSNYLEQPYNSALDFGTGDFSVMGWFKTSATAAEQMFLDRSTGSANIFRARILSSTSKAQFAVKDNTAWAFAKSNNALDDNNWHFLCGTKIGGTVSLYIDGIFEDTASGLTTTISSSTSPTLDIGHEGGTNIATNSSLALWRVSATAPTPEQIAKIYNDEKKLFQPNAKATLYGTSNAVTALAYDDDTNLLHAGTSAGRSEFQGLNRVNNTTDAVGTAISASNGFIVEE